MAKKSGFNYFDSFISMANHAYEAAQYLDGIVKNFDSTPAVLLEKVQGIHEIEHRADDERHEVITHLTTEFMTPIEREDIMEMIQKLDNVVDHIDDIMRTVYMFNITELSPAIVSFAELIVRCTEAMKATMEKFENFRKSRTIKEYIVKVNEIEDEGDLLHLDTIYKLFGSELPSIDVIRQNKLLDDMENCLDACEEVVDTVERIMMKNS